MKKLLIPSVFVISLFGLIYPTEKENTNLTDYCFSLEKILAKNAFESKKNIDGTSKMIVKGLASFGIEADNIAKTPVFMTAPEKWPVTWNPEGINSFGNFDKRDWLSFTDFIFRAAALTKPIVGINPAKININSAPLIISDILGKRSKITDASKIKIKTMNILCRFKNGIVKIKKTPKL